MFEWLPEVCRELRGNLIQLYWILLVPYVVFLICLEFFKMPDSDASAGKIMKRVVVSMLLLYSFEECMNTIAWLADGISERIGGLAHFNDLTKLLGHELDTRQSGWFRFKEHILYAMSFVSYVIAYVGVYVADMLTHFVWSILYVVSPLMILMYVSERTSFITTSLYRGLLNVLTWKVFWSILGVLLYKVATSRQVMESSTEDYLQAILLNLFIAYCMLVVPKATKSLLTNGMDSISSSFASMPGNMVKSALAPKKHHEETHVYSGEGSKPPRQLSRRERRNIRKGFHPNGDC